MAAKIRWMRGGWWVVVHYGGVPQKLRIGADEHLANEKAAAINRALARDEHDQVAPTLASFRESLDASRRVPNGGAAPDVGQAPTTLAELAEEWLRKEIALPCERGHSDLSRTKTGRERAVELSSRLIAALAPLRPDVFGEESLVFPSESSEDGKKGGGYIDPQNFRHRVFRKLVERVLGRGRDFTPHGLRHTFASLHLARGTNLEWIQAMGGWASAKLLLDLYGHHLPTETAGFADVLARGPEAAETSLTAPLAAPRVESRPLDARMRRRKSPKSLGAPGRDRTCDPLLRRQVLYPTELPGRPAQASSLAPSLV